MSRNTPKIVIVGGGVAAVLVSKTLAALEFSNVTAIAPDDKVWFYVPSPRLMVHPELLDQTVFDLPGILERNCGHKFVKGKVNKVDFEARELMLEDGEKICYDYVVFATGTKYDQFPALKTVDDHKKGLEAVKRANCQIKAAQSIAVIGGGPSGMETASEIGFEYGDTKKVVLYTGSAQPLVALGPAIGEEATKQLNALNVDVVNDVHVTFEEQEYEKGETSNGSGTRTFVIKNKATGEVVQDGVGLAIPTVGLKPNTGYLDDSLLDNQGYIKTDAYFRVENVDNAYAFGDAVAMAPKSIRNMLKEQAPVLKITLKHDLDCNETQLEPYTPPVKPTIIVPISKNGGVGLHDGFPLPNSLIVNRKSRDFLLSRTEEFFGPAAV